MASYGGSKDPINPNATRDDLAQQVRAMRQENEELDGADGSAKLLQQLGIKLKDGQNARMVCIIYNAMKTDGWREYKFFSTDQDAEVGAYTLLDYIGISKFKKRSDNSNKALRDEWVGTYQNVVNTCLNYLRSYIQGQVKTECMNYMKAHGSLPQPKLIYAINDRSIDLHNEENKKVACWWYDRIIPKIVGPVNLFNVDERCYKAISDCKLATKDGKQFDIVPPGTEAFAVSLFHNCRSKWTQIYKQKQNMPEGKTKITVKACKETNKCKEKANELFLYEDKNPKLKTKWSMPHSGQEKYGGWSPAGKEHWVKLTAKNATARPTVHGLAKEQGIMNLMRAKHSITAATPEAQAILDGRKVPKANANSTPRARIAGLFGDFDPEAGNDLEEPSDQED